MSIPKKCRALTCAQIGGNGAMSSMKKIKINSNKQKVERGYHTAANEAAKKTVKKRKRDGDLMLL